MSTRRSGEPQNDHALDERDHTPEKPSKRWTRAEFLALVAVILAAIDIIRALLQSSSDASIPSAHLGRLIQFSSATLMCLLMFVSVDRATWVIDETSKRIPRAIRLPPTDRQRAATRLRRLSAAQFLFDAATLLAIAMSGLIGGHTSVPAFLLFVGSLIHLTFREWRYRLSRFLHLEPGGRNQAPFAPAATRFFRRLPFPERLPPALMAMLVLTLANAAITFAVFDGRSEFEEIFDVEFRPEPEPPIETTPPTEPPNRDLWPATYAVADKDSFWLIASAVTVACTDSQGSASATLEYWEILKANNAAVLVVQGNPDLIYPGQVLLLPEPTGASTDNRCLNVNEILQGELQWR